MIETAGVAKARMLFGQNFTLALLAGVFIGFCGAAYLMVMTGVDTGFGPARFLGGVVFSLGLILVIIGGAELFTGNALVCLADFCGARCGRKNPCDDLADCGFRLAWVGAFRRKHVLIANGLSGRGFGEPPCNGGQSFMGNAWQYSGWSRPIVMLTLGEGRVRL